MHRRMAAAEAGRQVQGAGRGEGYLPPEGWPLAAMIFAGKNYGETPRPGAACRPLPLVRARGDAP